MDSPTIAFQNIITGTYEILAKEYYDSIRHPTCANFREASKSLLTKLIVNFKLENKVICDVGAGKSVVFELLRHKADLHNLFLLDSSTSMLAYSQQALKYGAHFTIGDASNMPFRSNTLDILISSLGDPYNMPNFWKESNRVLMKNGIMIFTTPAYEWATFFRKSYNSDSINWAEFKLKDGGLILVPSYIYSHNQQLDIFDKNGFIVKQIEHARVSDLKSRKLSPKILINPHQNIEIVTGYLLVKQ